MSPSRTANALTPEEARSFHERGYAGPFVLCSPGAMAATREALQRDVLGVDPDGAGARPASGQPNSRIDQSRHLDSALVWELCSHPAVVARVAGLLGDDLMLWRSNVWHKPPAVAGSAASLEIPWHQDWFYWTLEPMLSITAWIAIDPATVETACVRVIPGSHKRCIPHVAATGKHFQTMADPRAFDERLAVDMQLAPGEFFLFNERTLHQSPPNRSLARRVGLSARFTTPFVRVGGEEDFVDHPMLLVSGRDRFGFNRFGTPPRRHARGASSNPTP